MDRQVALGRVVSVRFDREIEGAPEEVVQEAGRVGDGPGQQLDGIVFVDPVVEDEAAEQLPSELEALEQRSLATK